MPARTPSPRQGRTQAERRATSEQRLLNATARVIAQRGTTSVSFADIAKVAGCSHGLPGYLFGSKTDLLLALVQDVLERFRTDLVAPAVGDDRGLPALLGMQRAFLESLARPLPYTRAIYVMMSETPALAPELQAAIRGHQEGARLMARDRMLEGIERGEIRPDIDPDAQAALWFGTMRGIGQQVLLDPDAIDVRAVTEEAIEAMTRTLASERWVEAGTRAGSNGGTDRADR
ncbi:MAG TPA: TetR family transcriptional regulator [Acidimicrobiales bacterium]|nr:TetR family transcriptional regulator [Acidimicrobiales bacterium]